MKIVNEKRFVLSILLILMTIISITNLVFAKDEQRLEEYVITQGETLWSIACENCPKNMDVRNYIYELRKINNMNDCLIYPGQVINIVER